MLQSLFTRFGRILVIYVSIFLLFHMVLILLFLDASFIQILLGLYSNLIFAVSISRITIMIGVGASLIHQKTAVILTPIIHHYHLGCSKRKL